MRKIFIFLFGLLLLASSVKAIEPFQPLQPIITVGAASQVLTQRNLVTTAISWNAATTARYLMIFDKATSAPGNGATTLCSTSHVSGCLLWCGFLPNSTTAPNLQTLDWGVHPIGQAQFGLVLAMSTGAGCGTLTIDGANNDWSTQAY